MTRLIRLEAGQPGQPLTLSKPLGAGVHNTRHKATGETFPEAVAAMTTLNRDASIAARAVGIRCGTDITGFGTSPVRRAAGLVSYTISNHFHIPEVGCPEWAVESCGMSEDNNKQILTGPPVAGDEIDTLVGSLERQRRTLAWKCGGLDATGLKTKLGASSVTLGGLLKHLALVEDEYFSRRLHGRELGPPWVTADWDADPDWEWHSAAEDSPEQLYALWQDAVARSRANLQEALAGSGLDQLIRFTWPDGRTPSLRRTLIDLIEEYARHTGHADLIRESIDGLVGEDPPE